MSSTASPVDANSPIDLAASPQAWRGSELSQSPERWQYQWRAAEIAEIENAVERALASGKSILEMRKSDFDMPQVENKLTAVKREVLHGQGFYLLRGLPIAHWTIEQAAIAFWGLGTHLGRACSQNGKGHVLGHVKNLGLDYDDPMARGYQTSARLPYHTDSSDIAALLCWRQAQSGGRSSVVSSTTVYREILRRAPELISTLEQPFYRTRWGEVPEGKQAWAQVPVFMPYRGRVISHYVRSAIRKGQLLPGAPPLTERQLSALDLVDSIAAEAGVQLDMSFAPGDIQLVCNHATWHSRTAYEDHPQPELRRHLLRLWLACPEGPALPHWMTEAYEGMTPDGRPNGIEVPGVPHAAPLEAQ